MRTRTVCRWLLTAVALICSARVAARPGAHQRDSTTTTPAPIPARPSKSPRPRARISPAGSRALQRHRRRVVRHRRTLTGIVPATCGAAASWSLNYPSNGIQNGAPDGIALVEPRHGGRVHLLRRRVRRHQRPGERPHLHRHRRAARPAANPSGNRWRAMPPASGAARPRVPSAPATTTARRRRRPKSRASPSRRPAARSPSARRSR